MDFERISFNRDKLASSIILILIIFLASTIGAGILILFSAQFYIRYLQI